MDIHLINLALSNNAELILKEEKLLNKNLDIFKILSKLRSQIDIATLFIPQGKEKEKTKLIIVTCDALMLYKGNLISHPALSYQQLAVNIKALVNNYLNPDQQEAIENAKKEKEAIERFKKNANSFAEAQQKMQFETKRTTASAADLITHSCVCRKILSPSPTPIPPTSKNDKQESSPSCTIQ